MYEGPGIYKHYKGGHYKVLGLARHEDTTARLVIYHSYSLAHELERVVVGIDFIARPLEPMDGESAFNTPVRCGTRNEEPRFVKVI